MIPPVYLQVNSKIIFNLVLAQYESFTSGKPIEFVCYTDQYAGLDWTHEPEETFDELMLRHAQYLRNKYQRVILSWSGGTDSQTIYNIFVKNNIHIDEIVCWVNDEYEPWNSTSNYVWMKNNHPDPTTYITSRNRFDPEGRRQVINNEDWLFQNRTLIPKFAMGTTDSVMQDYCDAKYGESAWCLITGHEQPNVFLRDGKYHCNHIAKTLYSVMGCKGVEPFYLDPVLTLKQSFMIKKFLQHMEAKSKFNQSISDEHRTHIGVRMAFTRTAAGYRAWSKVVGRHNELVTGVSARQKYIETGFDFAPVHPDNIDGTLTQSVDPGLAALLAKDVDVAKTFEHGIKNLLLERDFCNFLLESSTRPDVSLVGKSTGQPLFSKPYQIG